MKSLKKFLSMSLISALLLMIPFTMPVFADEAQTEPTPEPIPEIYFYSFTGTVREVASYYNQDGEEVEDYMYVLVENEDGAIVNFFVTDKTYMITDNEIAAGSKFTGYYSAKVPVIMIYPPQYTAVAAAVDFGDEQTIKIDRFDSNLVSADNTLKLNIADTTEIIFWNDGKAEEGESVPADRDLVVIYDISTRSIPAQTTPIKVIVLPVSPTSSGNEDTATDGEDADVPSGYVDSDGVVMVPLRAVAESLGYEVVWHHETQSVTINGNILITLGDRRVIIDGSESVELAATPLLVADAYTYVPMDFFTTVLEIGDIDLSESVIIVTAE